MAAPSLAMPSPLPLPQHSPTMPAKTGKAKAVPQHPPYLALVKEAIAATGKPVKGASRLSIVKYLQAKYGKVLGRNFKPALRMALKKAVGAGGAVVQTKGSFRLAKVVKKPKVKKPKKPKVKKAKKVKKPKAKKVKKPKAKKGGKKVQKPKASKGKKAAKPKKATKPKVAKPKKTAAAAAEAPKGE